MMNPSLTRSQELRKKFI